MYRPPGNAPRASVRPHTRVGERADSRARVFFRNCWNKTSSHTYGPVAVAIFDAAFAKILLIIFERVPILVIAPARAMPGAARVFCQVLPLLILPEGFQIGDERIDIDTHGRLRVEVLRPRIQDPFPIE